MNTISQPNSQIAPEVSESLAHHALPANQFDLAKVNTSDYESTVSKLLEVTKAAHANNVLNPDQAVSWIRPLLENSSSEYRIRYECAQALAAIGTPEAQEVLASMINGGDDFAVNLAASAIGRNLEKSLALTPALLQFADAHGGESDVNQYAIDRILKRASSLLQEQFSEFDKSKSLLDDYETISSSEPIGRRQTSPRLTAPVTLDLESASGPASVTPGQTTQCEHEEHFRFRFPDRTHPTEMSACTVRIFRDQSGHPEIIFTSDDRSYGMAPINAIEALTARFANHFELEGTQFKVYQHLSPTGGTGSFFAPPSVLATTFELTPDGRLNSPEWIPVADSEAFLKQRGIPR